MNKLMIFLYLVIGIILVLFIVRLVLHSEIDDVTVGISCESELLKKSDVLWVIPIYDNISIAENRQWCDRVLDLNKTLGLHGVSHTYEEFNHEKEEAYIERGINEFEKCFGEKPQMFKAPHLALSKENKRLVEEMNMSVKGRLNQIFHKVYHCSDSGKFPNWIISIF